MNASNHLTVTHLDIEDLGEAKPVRAPRGFIQTLYSFDLGGFDEFQARAEMREAEARQRSAQMRQAHLQRWEDENN